MSGLAGSGRPGSDRCRFRPLTFRDGERRRPLGPQDVQADAAVAVDVWVIDSGGEGHLEEEQTDRVRTGADPSRVVRAALTLGGLKG